MVEIRTVLGKKKISRRTTALSHEHICCYSEYLNTMSRSYLDKNELISDEYVNAKIAQITALCEAGFSDNLLLSHDDSVFQGFCDRPEIKEPRWSYLFEYIIPKLDKAIAEKRIMTNPVQLLCQ